MRVLFFGEAVTLAHVARPMTLAAGLSALGHECAIAADSAYDRFLRTGPWQHIAIQSLPSKDFVRALATGRPHHSYSLLNSYVEEDLRVIADYQPDIVIGDFRLSLQVSARMAGVPYAAIANAYWSPLLAGKPLPVPVLPVTRVLPVRWVQAVFDWLGPLAVARHCAPVNQLRREHGFAELGNDLRRCYSDADFHLYPDIETLFGLGKLPAQHTFIGPVQWEASNAEPAWWDDRNNDRPTVYLSLGSSGHGHDLQIALDALAELSVNVIASTAGAPRPNRIPANAKVADFLPGGQATERSTLIVCNGGSLSVNQALAKGAPVLGIASNIDQFLNMAPVQAAGLGSLVRADRINAASLRASAKELLDNAAYRRNALATAQELAQLPSAAQCLDQQLRLWLGG